jgi:hypothetical protein
MLRMVLVGAYDETALAVTASPIGKYVWQHRSKDVPRSAGRGEADFLRFSLSFPMPDARLVFTSL